jgi:hypothetical protein
MSWLGCLTSPTDWLLRIAIAVAADNRRLVSRRVLVDDRQLNWVETRIERDRS